MIFNKKFLLSINLIFHYHSLDSKLQRDEQDARVIVLFSLGINLGSI